MDGNINNGGNKEGVGYLEERSGWHLWANLVANVVVIEQYKDHKSDNTSIGVCAYSTVCIIKKWINNKIA